MQFAPIVHIPSAGDVRGLVEQAYDEKIYFYQGIRYGRILFFQVFCFLLFFWLLFKRWRFCFQGEAKRFEKPVPASPWSGVLNATKYRDACPQFGKQAPNSTKPSSAFDFETMTMSEDCLYLNVWQPSKGRSNRPVMVYFHGGAFQIGTIFSMFYDAKLMSQIGDVVVVSISYRLSMFGFLYAGESKDSPGNLGFHDQILALKWIRGNIHLFGGDPKQVTLFGQSSGSMSVAALVLSPLAKNLFHRAILQSGSSISFSGATDKKTALKTTMSLCEILDCPTGSAQKILQCLKQKPLESILNATNVLNSKSRLVFPIYGDDVMPIKPQSALKSGRFNHVDMLFGAVKDEGSLFVTSLSPEMNPSNQHPNMTIQLVKQLIRTVMIGEPDVDKIVEYYSANLTKSNMDDLR